MDNRDDQRELAEVRLDEPPLTHGQVVSDSGQRSETDDGQEAHGDDAHGHDALAFPVVLVLDRYGHLGAVCCQHRDRRDVVPLGVVDGGHVGETHDSMHGSQTQRQQTQLLAHPHQSIEPVGEALVLGSVNELGHSREPAGEEAQRQLGDGRGADDLVH